MNLIQVLQRDGKVSTLAFHLPEEIYAREKVGSKLWFFRLNNDGIEEIFLNDESKSWAFYKCGSAMYKTLAANYTKGHYEVCPMSDFIKAKQQIL